MIQFESRCRLHVLWCGIAAILTLNSAQLGAQTAKSYQAEVADFYHAKVEIEHSGFTGSGYVNFDNEAGSYLEFAVFMAETDTQMVYLRYANGAIPTGTPDGAAARPMQVMVDSTSLAKMPEFLPTGAWTNWLIDSIEIALVTGVNRLRFTSTTADGGPNIDKIEVIGEPGIVQYEIVLEVIGSGSVTTTPTGTFFDAGTVVELQAIPDSGWQFLAWSGDTSATLNPLALTINSVQQIIAIFTTGYDAGYQFESSPTGFTAVDELGQNGTNGGTGGDTVIVATGAELYQILDSRRDPHFDQQRSPLVVLIQGTLTWTTEEMMDLKETYDLSLIGVDDNAQIAGFGLNVFRSHNIIIRNLEFRDAPDDCINVTDSLSHHIWIDHCTFSDSPNTDPNGDRHDGLLDIKHGASYITVSWNHFYNHQKTALLGHSDTNAEEDVGRLKVTYHHNWWDNTGSRHPRVRFGEVHVYNNYYDNSQGKMGYGIASTMEADVVVEANYFKDVGHPTYVGYGDSEDGDLVAINNVYENCGAAETRGSAFNPAAYYNYQLDDPAVLPALLIAWCGSGKMNQPPIAVAPGLIAQLPDGFELMQNFPNPFNPTTSINFKLPTAGPVKLVVFDLLGKEVMQIINEYRTAGFHSVLLDAAELPSGTYIYQLQAKNYCSTRKMILLK